MVKVFVAVGVILFLSLIYYIFKSLEKKEREETNLEPNPSIDHQTHEELINLRIELEQKQKAVQNLQQADEIKKQLEEVNKQLESYNS